MNCLCIGIGLTLNSVIYSILLKLNLVDYSFEIKRFFKAVKVVSIMHMQVNFLSHCFYPLMCDSSGIFCSSLL
ncbi:Mas-related G-protein coupled receptor member A4 [Trichinella spiralis]|uniref:Mas-related G-protein coupled receptor member A4 n=1 Tax=Trichinella spiralis TaxID=6334 RepID=UPI0001EFD35E|nr:Mas-related G-protein coupled receptor member A4 [Trichinella spiralis]